MSKPLSGTVAPNTRTPNPQPSRSGASVPSRASFQVTGSNSEQDTGASAKSHTPHEGARTALPKLPTRAAAGRPEPRPAKPAPAPPPDLEPVEEVENAGAWAEEMPERKGANMGPVGLIAAAVLLMVGVYLAATILMK